MVHRYREKTTRFCTSEKRMQEITTNTWQGPSRKKNRSSKPTSKTKRRTSVWRNWENTQSILERTGSFIDLRGEACPFRRHRLRQQIGTVTIERREVGILGNSLNFFTILRPVLVVREINFSTTDGVCRQTHLSHDMFEHVQFIRTVCSHAHSLTTRTRVAQGSPGLRTGVLKIICHPSVMFHPLQYLSLSTSTRSFLYFTYLPTSLSLTVLSSGTGSIYPARFTAEWRIHWNPSPTESGNSLHNEMISPKTSSSSDLVLKLKSAETWCTHDASSQTLVNRTVSDSNSKSLNVPANCTQMLRKLKKYFLWFLHFKIHFWTRILSFQEFWLVPFLCQTELFTQIRNCSANTELICRMNDSEQARCWKHRLEVYGLW